MLPAAARPITRPCFSGGYQRLASGSATEKDAPDTPSIIPITSSDEKLAIRDRAWNLYKIFTPNKQIQNRDTTWNTRLVVIVSPSLPLLLAWIRIPWVTSSRR